jgi:hypothetical protein
VGDWIADCTKAGVVPHEFGVFVRSPAQLDRACAAVKATGLASMVLDEHVEIANGHVSISTMHLAKGLEFRAVVVMACENEIIPLQERIETVGDDADLQEVYDTERQLCTSLARVLGIICWSAASTRFPSSWTISLRAFVQFESPVGLSGIRADE